MTGPRVLPESYGPSGDQIAGAFARREARRRQGILDTQEQARFAHEQGGWGLEDAIRRATAREHGIVGPGEAPGVAPPAATQPLPPAQVPSRGSVYSDRDPGFALPGPGRDVDPGFTQPGPQRDIDPGFTAPRRGGDIYDMTPVQGTAHALPGAFNPVTGTHNPADVDLGGGYHLQGTMTPEGRRSRDVAALTGAHIPGITPELAMYLADHPEHIAPFIQRAYGRAGQRWEPQSEEEALDYEGKLAALRRRETQPRGELTMEQALAQVDEAYSQRDPISGEIKSSQLSMPARMRTAREVMRGDYSHLGRSRRFGTPPLDRGQGGTTSPRHVTKDQKAYLQHTGKWDESRYIVDPD